MTLTIGKEVPDPVPRLRLTSLARRVFRGETGRLPRTAVNLVFTTDSRLRALNRQYRKLNEATDVLSFNLDPLEQAGGTLGEIYISTPYARRQAAKAGKGVQSEYLLLFCHGLLHLLGYDHATSGQEREMFDRQLKYLEAEGLKAN